MWLGLTYKDQPRLTTRQRRQTSAAPAGWAQNYFPLKRPTKCLPSAYLTSEIFQPVFVRTLLPEPRACERLIARSRPSTSSAAVQIRGSDPDNGGDETGRSPPPARQAAGAHTTLRTAAAARRRQARPARMPRRRRSARARHSRRSVAPCPAPRATRLARQSNR